MKVLGKIILMPVLLANAAVAALTLFSCYASLLPPFGKWPFASLGGLAFPFLAVLLSAFFVFWLFFWRRAALLPALTMVICLGPFLNYFPLHMRSHTQPIGSKSLTIMTYNTMGFGVAENGDHSTTNPVMGLAVQSGADIICMQESYTDILNHFTAGKGVLKEYPYIASDGGASTQAILSRYPIIKSESQNFGNGSGNSYQHALIRIGDDTISVYNCHFQSNHLDNTNLEDYNKILHNPSDTSNFEGMKKILKKLLESTSQRAQQAEMISQMAMQDSHRLKIVCGDFNDSPLSYTYRLFDKFMTNSWARSGFGPGITYHSHNLYYRIDHIFCSRNMKPYAIRRDTSLEDSDHYPVISHIAF